MFPDSHRVYYNYISVSFFTLSLSSYPPQLYVASQLTFTCSKSTEETLEKGVKYVASLQ